MKQVVVVIPLYKEVLKRSEIVALEEARKVLGRYDLCFMAPERMRYFLDNKNEQAQYWPDDCFANVEAYSQLLLTEEFYSRFASYEYMLIYQLDAFVFTDRLQEFCSMDYDYIGAPMPYCSSWGNMPFRVGNGGFSLRRIDACRRVVAKKAEIYNSTGKGAEFEFAEDKFFGYCGYDKQIQFTTPNTRIALGFAVEYDVMHVYLKLSESKLPFGCHAWSKASYWRIWEPFIKQRVSDWETLRVQELEKLPTISYRELRRRALVQYLVRRFYRKGMFFAGVIDDIIPKGVNYVLWGGGYIGGRAKTLLEGYGRNIRCFIDSKKRIAEVDGKEVLPPERLEEVMTGSRVIISITKDKYVKEVISSLEKMGYESGKDFVSYEEICLRLAKYYWDLSVNRWLGRKY